MKAAWRQVGGLGLVAALGLAIWIWPGAVPTRADSCTEFIVDGGFETGGAWELGQNPLPPQYVTYNYHNGRQSLALGITQGGNMMTYSSARQMVTIPWDASQVTLSFWFYAMVEGPTGADKMQLVLLDQDGSPVYVLWSSSNDSRTWNQLTFDLIRWRGQTVQVYFNVYNDGVGGTAGMFLDDVSLLACTSGTAVVTPVTSPWPTNTPTPPVIPVPTCTPCGWLLPCATSAPPPCTVTPCIVTATLTPWPTFWPTKTPIVITPTYLPPSCTPSPPHCADPVQNGGFETGLADWVPGPDAIPAVSVTNPIHSGAHALRLGTQTQNLQSKSSIRQSLTISDAASDVVAEFWVYTWSEPNAGADYQAATVLAPDGSTIGTLWRAQANDRAWVRVTAPLIGYSGYPIVLYFNVFNDGVGGRTAMYLDDVRLITCGPSPIAIGTSPVEAVVVVPRVDPSVVTSGTTSLDGVLTASNWTPPVTRIALVLTPPATPIPPPTIRPTTSPPVTPQPGEGIFGRWPAGWWLGVAAIVLVILGALLFGMRRG